MDLSALTPAEQVVYHHICMGEPVTQIWKKAFPERTRKAVEHMVDNVRGKLGYLPFELMLGYIDSHFMCDFLATELKKAATFMAILKPEQRQVLATFLQQWLAYRKDKQLGKEVKTPTMGSVANALNDYSARQIGEFCSQINVLTGQSSILVAVRFCYMALAYRVMGGVAPRAFTIHELAPLERQIYDCISKAMRNDEIALAMPSVPIKKVEVYVGIVAQKLAKPRMQIALECTRKRLRSGGVSLEEYTKARLCILSFKPLDLAILRTYVALWDNYIKHRNARHLDLPIRKDVADALNIRPGFVKRHMDDMGQKLNTGGTGYRYWFKTVCLYVIATEYAPANK